MKRTWLAALAVIGIAVLPERAAAQDAPKAPTATAAPKPASATAAPKGPLPAGLEIMQRRERETLPEAEFAELDIRIEAAGAIDRSRRLERYVKRSGGLERLLVRFQSPPQYRSLAVLTIEEPAGDDQQWFYLPEQRKPKRVTRAESSESFAGTGFTFEDLRHEETDAHAYTTLGTLELQGRPAFEIEAIPIQGELRAMKGYAKRHIFVDAERLVELRIDFYDENSKYEKTQENTDWRQVGKIWRPFKTLMREPVRKRTTWIKFVSWETDRAIDDSLFTTRELAREDH